tara:strand:+ start:132 stop:512 length:381 start_codon:yes stop_codon:yes gene_type:complete
MDYSPPMITSCNERPWNMDPYKEVNILPLRGYQNMELYYPSRQFNLHFVLKPQECKLNGEILCDEPYLFEIKPCVFYRAYTGNQTSMMKFPSKVDIRTKKPINPDHTQKPCETKQAQKDRLSSAYL